jgi:hypothetical protein
LASILRRDLKSAGGLLSCCVPIWAETADSNQHQLPTPTSELLNIFPETKHVDLSMASGRVRYNSNMVIG